RSDPPPEVFAIDPVYPEMLEMGSRERGRASLSEYPVSRQGCRDRGDGAVTPVNRTTWDRGRRNASPGAAPTRGRHKTTSRKKEMLQPTTGEQGCSVVL